MRRPYNPYCNVCQGTGRIKVTTKPTSIGSLVTAIVEEMVPILAGSKKCWKCRGSGIYSGYQRTS